MTGVIVRSYPEPEFNLNEALRYCGAVVGDEDAAHIILESLASLSDKLSFRVVYREIAISVRGSTVELGFATVESSALARYLSGCDRAILFAASVGYGVDRMIRRNNIERPTRATFIDAVGSERVESLCDAFCLDMQKISEKNGYRNLNRFSPGYADCPLSLQKDIFSELSLGATLGATLNDSMLITPVKTVTAFIGMKKQGL